MTLPSFIFLNPAGPDSNLRKGSELKCLVGLGIGIGCLPPFCSDPSVFHFFESGWAHSPIRDLSNISKFFSSRISLSRTIRRSMDKCKETLSWLDTNLTDEKEEFEHQQKELEAIRNPIISKLYQSAGGAGMPGGMPCDGDRMGSLNGMCWVRDVLFWWGIWAGMSLGMDWYRGLGVIFKFGSI